VIHAFESVRMGVVAGCFSSFFLGWPSPPSLGLDDSMVGRPPETEYFFGPSLVGL